jgi:hypothetical protein
MLVIQFTMNFEDIWATTTTKERVIQLDTEGCKCKSIIECTNIFAKFLGLLCATLEKNPQSLRDWLEHWELHLSLKTTHAKLWVSLRATTDTLIHPVEGFTVWTYNSHTTQVMSGKPVFHNWTTSNG